MNVYFCLRSGVRWWIPFLLLLFGIAPKSKQKGLALNKFIYPLRSKKRNFKNSRKCSDSSKLIRFFDLWGPNEFMRREGKNASLIRFLLVAVFYRLFVERFRFYFYFFLMKRNAITEIFTTNSVERPFFNFTSKLN